jgi:selenocysteine lyase/cysteine desulfurase
MRNYHHYFDWAANGILTQNTIDHRDRVARDLQLYGSSAAGHYRMKLYDECRAAVGSLLNVPSSDVAILPNSSVFVQMLVNNLKSAHLTIGVVSDEYPSIVLPWELSGYNVVNYQGDIKDPEAIAAYFADQGVGLAVVSEVNWVSGEQLDIRRFCGACAEKGIMTAIDATQSMGIVHHDLKDVQLDIMFSSSYKWLQAGFGLAVAYLSPHFRNRFPGLTAGFGSFNTNGELCPPEDVRRYEAGHLSLETMAALITSISEKTNEGMQIIESRARKRLQALLDILAKHKYAIRGDFSAQKRGMIVNVKAPETLHQHLLEHGIQCSYRQGVRLSVHSSTPATTLIGLDAALTEING